MTVQPQLFSAVRASVGACRSGRPIMLAPMTTDAATDLGGACASMDPWKRYGISAERLTATFNAAGSSNFSYQIHCGDTPAGALIILHPWLIGPYIQFIAVLPAFQGSGLGSAVLDWFESTARAGKQRNIWLCVSGFNAHAQAVYAAKGWQSAGVLGDLVSDGVDEFLMRKRLS